ncbi:MAG TPA: hypothetical protein VJZ00_04385 [Thermoanaerobaculia bacterium]|nr:hypothetical protein [Thermoanaerobaculia bacterium]
MRYLVATLLLALSASAQTFDLTGYVAARGVNASGPHSWLEGGWGRLEEGADQNALLGVAQIGADWTPSEHFDVHVSGAARRDPEELGGTSAGVVEAYADARATFGLDELQLRAGQFFLPTSRENRDPLWASPYTINFSALNTWIGEEVRPVGVDLQYRHTTSLGHGLTFGATAFERNDTMGTLLGWRGWSIGNRLTTYAEVLPLPPLESLQTFFFRQRDDGTKPFGTDLDGKPGYSARVRYSIPQRANLLYTFVDNRGDRELYRGEYSWQTRFHLLGAEIGNPDNFIVAAEYMRGKTGMGIFEAFVQADFYATYLLVSEKRGRNRWSARYELFNTEERDFSPAESNDEHGRAWTLTWMYDLPRNVRLAAEFTQIAGHRVNTPDLDGRSVTLEARYKF